MKNRIAQVLGIALVMALAPFGSSVASAAPPAGGWEYVGDLTAPVRSTAAVDVSVNGAAQVSQELLDQVSTTTTCSSGVPETLPHLFRASDSTYYAITNGGLVLTPIDDTVPATVFGTSNVDPGAYELVLRFRCSTGGGWQGGVSASPARTVTIASVSSTSYLTLSCLTSGISGACTQDSAQYTKVPSGTSVTFGAVIRRVWSDGVTTHETATGVLQRAYTYGGSYSTAASSCSAALEITSDYQYRCSAGGVNFDPVTVQVISRNSVYDIGTPVLSPTYAVKGSTVTVSGVIQEQYSDNSYWPATTSTRYSIEFQPKGSTSWTTVVSSKYLATAGSYRDTFTMTGSGVVRTVVGTTLSTSATLTELTATETYQVGPLNLPREAAPKVAMPLTTTVKLLWSDNVYRDAPDATKVTLEFAPSFDSAADPTTLKWRDVGSTGVAAGKATFSPIPQATGFWRVAVGTSMSPVSFTTVTGSAVSTLTASVVPEAGQQPFVGSVSRYRVSATLTGYVGTEKVALYVDMGDGYQRITDFDAANAVSGTYSIRAGNQSGEVVPYLQARDSTGEVLAAAQSAPVFIDAIETYEISVVPPDRPVLESRSATITATVSGISFKGVRYAVPWSGDVEVQRRSSGTNWVTLTTKENAKGDRLSLAVPAIDKADYRVYWPLHEVASKSFELDVLTPTGVVRLANPKASPSKVEKGERANLSVQVLAEYSDGKFYGGTSGSKVVLETLSGGNWKQTKVTYSDNGRVVVQVRPGSTTSYRFTAAGDVATKTLTVTVVVPQPKKLVVDWPDSWYETSGGRISVYVRATNGDVWNGRTGLQLQYRSSTSEPWRTFQTKSYSGSRVRMGWGPGSYPYYNYFRVVAPEYGLWNQKGYCRGC